MRGFCQLTFTCSMSTIETLEKVLEYVEVNNKNTRAMSVVLVFLLLTLNIFHSFF